MRIDAFIDPDEFKRQIDDWIRTFRKTKPAPGTDGPIIPGDPEREAEVVRRVEGIPLVAAVVEEIHEVGPQVLVYTDVGERLGAEITRGALRELDLRPGAEVYLVIKTSSIGVIGRL